MKIDNVPIKMMVDSGATTDIIDETTFRDLQRHTSLTVAKSKPRILPYGSTTPLPLLGKFTARLETKFCYTVASIYACKGGNGLVLSFQTATELGLLDVHVNKISITSADIEQMASQYPKLFYGVGDLRDLKITVTH